MSVYKFVETAHPFPRVVLTAGERARKIELVDH
jgi:hypothetical protein